MSNRTDILGRVSDANPVPDADTTAEGLDLHSELLALIDRRERVAPLGGSGSGGSIRRQRRRSLLAFAGGLVAVLVALGSMALLSRGKMNVAAPPADQPSTTLARTEPAAPDVSVLWTEVVDAGEGRTFLDAVVTDGRWLAVGGPAGFRGPENGSDIPLAWSSVDGISWTQIEHQSLLMPADSNWSEFWPGIAAIVFDDSRFVGVGQWDGDAVGWASDDGVIWVTTEFVGSGTRAARDVVAGGPGFVAVGHSDYLGRIWISKDGSAWTSVDDELFYGVDFERIHIVGDELVAIGTHAEGASREATSLRWVSGDGLTWTPQPQQAEIGLVTHEIITNSEDGSMLAFGIYGVWRSEDDGKTWTELFSSSGIPPYTHPSSDPVWLGDLVFGLNHGFVFVSSDGGTTWNRSMEGGPERNAHALVAAEDAILVLGGQLWIGRISTVGS